MHPRRILITGGTGCVGRYLIDELLRQTEHHIVAVLRDPAKLPVAYSARDRLTVVSGDLASPNALVDIASGADVAVLAAACWGGSDTFAINVEANYAIAASMLATPGRHLFYFSSASVLNRDNALLPAAAEFGTEYIRSKYRQVEVLESLAGRAAITGLFPTLVLGGGGGYPYSHFARLLQEAGPYARLIRLFRADGRFHFVHAADIARTVRLLLENPPEEDTRPQRLVLGNPAVSVDDIIEEFCAYLGAPPRVRIRLQAWMGRILVPVFRIRLSDWDKYCIANPDQSYNEFFNPSMFGQGVSYPTLSSNFSAIDLGSRSP